LRQSQDEARKGEIEAELGDSPGARENEDSNTAHAHPSA